MIGISISLHTSGTYRPLFSCFLFVVFLSHLPFFFFQFLTPFLPLPLCLPQRPSVPLPRRNCFPVCSCTNRKCNSQPRAGKHHPSAIGKEIELNKKQNKLSNESPPCVHEQNMILYFTFHFLRRFLGLPSYRRCIECNDLMPRIAAYNQLQLPHCRQGRGFYRTLTKRMTCILSSSCTTPTAPELQPPGMRGDFQRKGDS